MPTQEYTDTLIERTVLPFIPRSVTPNQVTWVRIALLPFIFYFLLGHRYVIGLTLFAIAAFTDALDGAMARKRNQITETGKVLDPIADRGLIGVVAITILPALFGWWMIGALLVLELFNTAMAYRSRRKLRVNPGANWAGKVKMILQCVAFCGLFIGLVSGGSLWLSFGYVLMLISFAFTLVQGFLYE